LLIDTVTLDAAIADADQEVISNNINEQDSSMSEI
jgi:hypothetical protein